MADSRGGDDNAPVAEVRCERNGISSFLPAEVRHERHLISRRAAPVMPSD
jgi:hypothetical protein